MRKKLTVLVVMVAMVASMAVAVNAFAATGDEVAIKGWSAPQESAYAITNAADGGIATVSYSGNTWHMETIESAETKIVDRVEIAVENYAAAERLSFKFVSSGAKSIKAYVHYAAGKDAETLEDYPEGEKYITASLMQSSWSCAVAEFSTFTIATVDLTAGDNGTVLKGKTVTKIMLAFDDEETAIKDNRSVEFLGIAFHAKSESPLLQEQAIGAPTLKSMESGSVVRSDDGSYTIAYTKSNNYATVEVPVFNYTAEYKCVTLEFTPYAGMKLGIYYYLDGVSTMVKTHTVYPVAEKQTFKFTAGGKVTGLRLYADSEIEVTEERSFVFHSVTIEKNWPVIMSDFTVEPGSSSILREATTQPEDFKTYKMTNTNAGYACIISDINPDIWNKMTATKLLVLTFTPRDGMKVGVHADGRAISGVDETGAVVAAGHADFAAGVKKTVTYTLRDADFDDGSGNIVPPSVIKVYFDAGVASATEKRITLHSFEMKGEPTVDEITGDAVHYVKYDAATHETVVKFTSHGVAWYKLTMGLKDFVKEYDVIAFRIKADQKMSLGIRLEYKDGSNTDIRPHSVIDANTSYDLLYLTGEDIGADTVIEMYLDAPSYSPFPVEDKTETTFTIMGIDFLRSADLAVPTLTIQDQTLRQPYTGTNQIIEPVVTISQPLLDVSYEYLDASRPDAKWSNTAPIHAGTYKVRVSTVLTREYMTVSNDTAVTLIVTKAEEERELPEGALLFDCEAGTLTFSATVEVNTSSDFLEATAVASGSAAIPGGKYYARLKEDKNNVAGKTAEMTAPSRVAAPAFTIDFTGSTTNEVIPATVEYSLDGVNWTVGTGAKLTLEQGKTYQFRTKATDTAFVSETVVLDVPTKPTKPAPTLKERGVDFIELNAIEHAVYSIDGGTTWQKSSRFENLTANKEYTILMKIEATTTSFASATAEAKFVTEEGKKGCKGNMTSGFLMGGILMLSAAFVLIGMRRKKA